MLVTATKVVEHLCPVFLIYRSSEIKGDKFHLPSNHSSGEPVNPGSVALGTLFFFGTNACDLFGWPNSFPSVYSFFCCCGYCFFISCYGASSISTSGFGSLTFCRPSLACFDSVFCLCPRLLSCWGIASLDSSSVFLGCLRGLFLFYSFCFSFLPLDDFGVGYCY